MEIDKRIKLLTRLERGIFELLQTHPYAITTKAIRNEIIMQKVVMIYSDMDILLTYVPTLLSKPIRHFHLDYVITEAEHLIFRKNVKRIWRSDKSLYNKIGESDKVMPVPIPSFRSIEKATSHLLKEGLVVRRLSPNSKTKGYWAINPFINIKVPAHTSP